MAEPVTIGGETYIKTADGWIDKKTKLPVNKGLISLLDSLSTGEPAKKIRVKIDRNRDPISFAGQKYVYDLNQKVWIDEKTRMVAPESLQKTFNGIDTVNKEEVAPVVTEALGTVGIAGRQKAKALPKKPIAGRGQIPVLNNKKINTPLVEMINHLVSIDSFLKQKIKNSKLIAEDEALSAREALIEAQDPTAQTTETKPDAERVGGSFAGTAIASGLALVMVPGVQDAIGGVVNFAKKASSFLMSAVSTITGVFKAFNSGDASNAKWPDSSGVPAPSTGEIGSTNAPPSAPADAQAESKPGFFSSVGTGAVAGGLIGAALPFVKMRTGAIVGAGIAAYNYFGGSSSGSSGSQPSSGGGSSGSSASGGAGATATPEQTSTATPDAQKVATPDGSNMSGLRLKSGETTAGGAAADKTVEFAKIVQSQVPELNRFTAFNDAYHQGKRSKHNQGLAFDFTIKDPSQSSAIANKVKALADANGYKVKVLNEYTNPSSGATGGHIHVSVLGPGTGSTVEDSGGSGSGGMMDAVGNTIEKGIEEAGKLVGALAATIFGPDSGTIKNINTPLPDYSSRIKASAISRNTAEATAKTPKQDLKPAIKSQPNIAPASTATVENPPTSTDQQGPLYYLERFGFEISGTDPLAKPAA